MIKVSDTASKKIIAMMQEDGFDAAKDYVRVGVKSGGCSGLSYDLKFDKEIGENDKIFEDNLQNNMDIMLQEFSGYELPDELEEKYRKLFSDMMKQVKYTVAEAKEVENKNFTVDVKVEPMLIFNDTYQELQKQTEDYATQVSNEVMNGASLPSETDMQTHVFEIYHDILRNYLDQGMKYGDPETITVHVNKDDKNVYTIADEDISKIDGKVMAMDVIEQ